MSALFTPLRLRGLEVRNRIFVSPMCQYSSHDGLPTDWHLVHLGSRAVGGAGLVMVEASAVTPEGRISPFDSGIWSEAHAAAFRPIARFLREHGAVPAIQIAHAGRKASTGRPWEGGRPIPPEAGGWRPIAPSAIPFSENHARPREMTADDIDAAVASFERAARLSVDAGFEAVEIHGAHGYLIHEFLSPHSNRRTDDHGGPFENRVRFPLRVARAVRAAVPAERPVLVRISATDWAEGGWDIDQSVRFAALLKEAGVDLVDCSSGGAVSFAKVPVAPGYQVPFAERIRRETGIATGAVGLIAEARQAEEIIASGRADAVLLARAMLRDPYWPLRAARALGVEGPWPPQYLRAKE